MPLSILSLASVVSLGIASETGYVTGAPVPNWLGLATLNGRDAIQLGEGCDGVMPGLNVMMDDAGDLQVVDPLLGPAKDLCAVATRVHMSDLPCARNPTGACDVAFSN